MLDEVEPDEVVIAIPSASGELRGRVVMACRKRGIPVRTTPTVFELLRDGSGQLQVTRQLREVRVEDILGREPVREQLEQVSGYLRGQVVLVTGAGGSIGSELCRQIARVGPQRLIMVDHAEDNLFEIQRELEEDRHVRTAVPVLADCKEEERMREVLAEYRPAAIFHAAAYKHVGMMEANPLEAVRNNALATRLVARIAGEKGVGTFVLISTDKAVAPKTVMGASKALAEWAVEGEAARFPGTRYATVRFGNVLGSSGSVVPIFRRQIAAGGPVTVTDERMRRFFMTIPEAVQLVIRAGSLGESSGEVYVLEMGEPVSILELAAPDDPPVGPGARPRHRDRDHRRPPGREILRGAVRRPRARAADAGPADHARRSRSARSRPGSSRSSPTSTCSCSRATPRRSPRTCSRSPVPA